MRLVSPGMPKHCFKVLSFKVQVNFLALRLNCIIHFELILAAILALNLAASIMNLSWVPSDILSIIVQDKLLKLFDLDNAP